MDSYEILLYYKYTDINDPESLVNTQRDLCKTLNLKGRIIIAKEGINGTVEGLKNDTQQYIDNLKFDKRFEDIQFKRSLGNGNAFPKLSVKFRSEIVSSHLGMRDINPQKVTGKYLDAETLHQWFLENKKFYIVDMRNDYEYKVGHFAGSILPDFENFRDLPKVLPLLESLKNKPIVTVCTGGVRCEKASGFLVDNGFLNVYQLHGGIVTYMEKYPNEHFLGKLYVFDGRIVMGFNTYSPNHVVIGKCSNCGKPSEHYINCSNNACHLHFILCEDCLESDGKGYCSDKCLNVNI